MFLYSGKCFGFWEVFCHSGKCFVPRGHRTGQLCPARQAIRLASDDEE